MSSLRDLLVCGPAVILMTILRDAGWGWGYCLLVGVLLCGLLRFLSELIGLERAVEGQRAAGTAMLLAKRAEEEAAVRSGAGGQPAGAPSLITMGLWFPEEGRDSAPSSERL